MPASENGPVARARQDSGEVPGWVGARTTWSLMMGSVACLAAVLLLSTSLNSGTETILVGLMMGLGLLASGTAFTWFRAAGNMEDAPRQRLSAGIAMVVGLLIFALPLLVWAWVMLFYQGQ